MRVSATALVSWYRRAIRLLEAKLEIFRDPYGNVLANDSRGVGLR